eukprot:FR734650.1.p1 GENE.FR734650.1~~FR734650.1.p1  ORF type:complete len:265 (+),score=15.67 FR734650.1:58-795(+)
MGDPEYVSTLLLLKTADVAKLQASEIGSTVRKMMIDWARTPRFPSSNLHSNDRLTRWAHASSSLDLLCSSLDQDKRTFCAVCGSTEGLKACASCRSVKYCSTSHQKAHWKSHKKECALLKERKKHEREDAASCHQDIQYEEPKKMPSMMHGRGGCPAVNENPLPLSSYSLEEELRVGVRVIFRGLVSMESLNGLTGVIRKMPDRRPLSLSDRCVVELPDGAQRKIKIENLMGLGEARVGSYAGPR